MHAQRFRSNVLRVLGVRATVFAALLLALTASAPSTVVARRPAQTALDRYVKTPDPAYNFSVITTQEATATRSLLEMTSQTWLTAKEIDRPPGPTGSR